MQTNNAQDLQKQGDDAVAKIERWNLRQYFFNVLKLASTKKHPWPRIDFTLNGQMLFRLEIVEEDKELEMILKYYGAQDYFAQGKLDNESLQKCMFMTLPDDDENSDDDEKPTVVFKKCPLNKQFSFVLQDPDSASNLCYAASFQPINMDTFEKVLALVLSMFKLLEGQAKSVEQVHRFSNAPQWSVERLFYNTLNDAAAVAIEVKSEKMERPETDSAKNLSPEKVVALEAEWERINNESQELVDLRSIVSSCQLHADIWHYNDRHRIFSIGRQYENMGKLQNIGDAMHVPFRGAADELQKQIYVAEFLMKMLPIICVSIE